MDLVERYDRNRDSYRASDYKEAQLRQEFIDPLLELLGWDVDNRQGAPEAYKEVIHEDALRVGGSTKAPDYAIRVGGTRKFFVEAKKPSVNLKDDPEPALQLRRYGWTAKLPLCILTDFEEFVVYDTRIRPTEGDAAATARVRYFTYKAYAAQWQAIYDTFSKEAVIKGSFDAYAKSERKKKGTSEVDDAFLEDIEGWREGLAKNIALRNPSLSQREMNYAVQATIDRIIFLRICEDRGIETHGRLQTLAEGKDVYRRLVDAFRLADQRYNSGIFHFEEEKERAGSPDTLTPGLAVDDDVLKRIVKDLYYPQSPYEFSILPAEILGQVYEQFLGKVIRLTEGHRAKVEEKPEVKKAGGVFYTPTYIVDYIVKNTVGKLLDGKTPKEAAELRIVDPACGSGSFLLGAYQYLLDWHSAWYEKDGPKKRKKELYETDKGTWAVTLTERKRILLSNIYGVDIDPQAAEVTKLSLLLKCLEQASGDVIDKNQKLFHERALPDLESNVKCGNTLLDYRHVGQTLLDDETRHRVNPFDWKTEFSTIFERGGFDAVIGNPPYIRVQTMTEWAPLEVELYKKHYKAASKGNYDIYVCFVERGLGLLNPKGRLGYILPHKFFNAQYGEPLRGLIADGGHLAGIVHFGDLQVFHNATTYTCLLFLDKSGAMECAYIKIADLARWRMEGATTTGQIPAARIGARKWNFHVGEGSALFEKLDGMPVKLGDAPATKRIFQGIKTSGDSVFIVEARGREGNDLKVRSKSTGKEHIVEPGLWHPLVKGGDSRSYYLASSSRFVLFPYVTGREGKAELIGDANLRARFPKTYRYLLENRHLLEERERGRMKGSKWYAYIYPKALDVMPLPKIFTPDMAPAPRFSTDLTGELFFTGGAAGGYGILAAEGVDTRYLLGLLNSKLLFWFLRRVTAPFRGGWFSFEARFIEQLPIRLIEVSKPADKTKHDRMVGLVTRMLDTHKRLAAARVNEERTSLQRQIDAANAEIDRLVYELYGLTEEDIKIVESAT